MSNHVWRDNYDFDRGIHTQSGPVDGRLYFGGIGYGFTLPSDETRASDVAVRRFRNGMDYSSNAGVRNVTHNKTEKHPS